ncbi:MAG: DMT family transporter, partial [Acetobacteraceae bacterium]
LLSLPMSDVSNVIASRPITQPPGSGIAAGSLGVLAFSFTLPAIAFGETGGWHAIWLGPLRAVPAGLIAAVLLWRWRAPVPGGREFAGLGIVAAGIVFGFPWFSALALTRTSAAHAAVIVGLLPIATAAAAVLRAGERPRARFWLTAFGGLAAILAFAAASGAGRPGPGDLYTLAAVVLGGIGYAEGGRLARRLGGPVTVCWALIVSLPVLLPVLAVALARFGPPPATAGGIGAFCYVSLVSMLLGFFAWYRGLAAGGIARIGQLQLAQPLLTLLWSFLLLGESVSDAMIATAFAVLVFVVLTQRTESKAWECQA